jgi:hypothetical protein
VVPCVNGSEGQVVGDTERSLVQLPLSRDRQLRLENGNATLTEGDKQDDNRDRIRRKPLGSIVQKKLASMRRGKTP